MSKYLIQGSYTAEGIKGLIKDGGTSRSEAVAKLASAVGGSLESIHFSATKPDYFIVMQLPEKGSAAALAATVIGSGTITVASVTELLTPAQMDETVKKIPSFRAPGS